VPRGGVSSFDSRVSSLTCVVPISCVNSRCVSVRPAGQTLLSVRPDIAASHADRQECLSYQNPATSCLYFFSTRKLVAQWVRTYPEPRDFEQIFQIAPRQIREEWKVLARRRVRWRISAIRTFISLTTSHASRWRRQFRAGRPSFASVLKSCDSVKKNCRARSSRPARDPAR